MTTRALAPRGRSRSRVLGWLGLAACLLAGCGYRTGIALAERRSLGVEIFDNTSRVELAPGIERDLHRQISDVLIRLADAELVDPDDADRRITGRILRYHHRPGVRDVDNRLLETGLRIAVEAEIRDRSGDVLRSTRVSSQSGYVLDRYEAEREASERVLGNIAERLVLDLVGTLDYEPDD